MSVVNSEGAIFPIFRKIADQKSTTPVNPLPVNGQRRPQQRPRSISPPLTNTQFNTFQPQPQTRPRSTTPPGFSSTGQMTYPQPVKKNNSLDNLHKLWDTIPNTTSYAPLPSVSSSIYQTAVSSRYYGNQHNHKQQLKDTVYSFNQYSSYYNNSSMKKKYNSQNNGYYKQQQQKPMWQDDETYNKYHWSRSERNPSPVSLNSTPLSYSGYSFGRHAQEVC